MAISDGQRVRALESNAAWASKSADNTLVGKQTLARGGSGGTIVDLQQTVNDLIADVAGFIPTAEKGVANGVASLDPSGRIPSAQLTVEVMEFKGVWNASTNTPTLADGAGDAGDVYRVGTAGTQDLGSGSVAYTVGELVIYNGSIWEKTSGSSGSNWTAEFRTITGGEATAKQLTLADTPLDGTQVCLDVIGGGAQFYGDDYTVTGSVLDWNGLGLDGILSSGDKIRLMYAY